MNRAVVLALAIVLGFTLAGCAVGSALGLMLPGFYRGVFQVSGNDPFRADQVGVGVGAILGFFAGSLVIAARMIAGVLPGLSHQQFFAGRSFQPTFAGLLCAVAVLGVGLATLKHPSRGAAQSWFSLTILVLAWATLIAINRPIGRRGFAAGFAVFGWTYLILSLCPESRAQLPTSDLLAALEKQVSGSWRMGVQVLSLEMGPFPARQRGSNWEPVVTSLGGIPGTLQIDEVQPEVRRIGHSLFALLLGVVGGVLGDLLVSRSRGGPASCAAEPSREAAFNQRSPGHG